MVGVGCQELLVQADEELFGAERVYLLNHTLNYIYYSYQKKYYLEMSFDRKFKVSSQRIIKTFCTSV